MENLSRIAAPAIQEAQPVGLSTGNAIVDSISQMRFEGNIVDHRWFLSPRLRSKSGLVNGNAIHVLADIVFWHTAAIERDHQTQTILTVRKRFTGAEFWQAYEIWARALGLTARQLRDAVAFLCAAGVISRRTGQITLASGVRTQNVAIITLNVDILHEITYGTPSPRRNHREVPHVKTGDASRQPAKRSTPKREITNREHTETTHQPQHTGEPSNVVVDNKSLLSGLISIGMSRKRAEVLASEHPTEMMRRLEFLPYVENVKSPAAIIAARPDEPWTPPRKFQTAKAAEETETAHAQALEADKAKKAAATARRTELEAENAMLDAEFLKLPASERAEIEREAADKFRRLSAAGLASKSALNAAKRNIMRRGLGIPVEDLTDD